MSTLSVNPIPLPLQDNLVLGKDRKKYPKPTDIDPKEYQINPLWADAFIQQATQSASAPLRLNTVPLTNQSASIGATDFSGGSIGDGFYEIRYYMRVTVVGTISSSLQIAFTWVDGGATQTENSFPAITGNTTSTHQTGILPLIHADNNSPVTYAITYASNAAGTMKFSLTLVLSRIAS